MGDAESTQFLKGLIFGRKQKIIQYAILMDKDGAHVKRGKLAVDHSNLK